MAVLILAWPPLALAATPAAGPTPPPAPAASAPAAASPAPTPAAPAHSAPAHSAAAPTPPAPPPPAPDMIYYPAAAKAAGIEGQATLHCGRNTHLKLENCSLVSEIPAGQGFGAAAMAMAAANIENPKVTTTESQLVDPQDIMLKFVLHPQTIDPDITLPAHVNSPASLVTRPTREQLQAAYPVRALSDQVDGGAYLDCVLTKAGVLTGCKVMVEAPEGYGFGQAALEVANDFKITPREVDGEPIDSEVHLPVKFTVADPDGPLMLKTLPPGTPPPR
ncbi:MAG TPA: TonB family protein [Caulobacteraceae bacterium]|nr:TonB family protein [Caulobacteraceae bacterium]